ncbi:MAG: hypothetical protein FWC09_07605 [Lachnospiraceae bacterium]|nr:hypothetical protein [Lachnospiraceae bacterium]
MNKNKANAENKAKISSQNKDTGLPSYKDDTKPYEQKNMPAGAFMPSRNSR